MQTGGRKHITIEQKESKMNKCPRLVVLASILINAATAITAAVPEKKEDLSYLPITLEEAYDESTLDLKITAETDYQHPDFPGKKLSILKVTYFSHDWIDGPWNGAFKIFLPAEIATEMQGRIAMCPGGTSRKAPREIEIERDLLAGTALLFGIPVCTFPNPPEDHFDRNEIHRVCDKLIAMLLEKQDVSLSPNFPYVALCMRAFTAAGKVAGFPTREVVMMGTSITGHYAFQTATYDKRIVGCLPTGDDGHSIRPTFEQLTAKFNHLYKRYAKHLPEGQTADFSIIERLADAPEEFKQACIKGSSRGVDSKIFRATVFQINGASDFAVSHPNAGKYMDALKVPNSFAQVPNYPHGCAGKVHLNGFRSLIDHCFLGRPLSKAAKPAVEWQEDGSLLVTAAVEGEPEIRSAQVHWIQTKEEKFLKKYASPGQARGFEHVTNAKLAPLEMTKQADGQYAATIPLEAEKGGWIAFYVTFEDFAGKTAGHVSTPYEWIRLP